MRIERRWRSLVALGALVVVLQGGCSDQLQRVTQDGAAAPDGVPFPGVLYPPDIWARSWGSVGDDVVTRLVRDRSGNLIFSGYATNSVMRPWAVTTPWEGGVPGQGTVNTHPDRWHPQRVTLAAVQRLVFVTKLNVDGVPLWVVPFRGGFDGRYQHGLATDREDNIYVAGSFSGSATVGERTLKAQGSTDILVAKLSPQGEVRWIVTFGGQGGEVPPVVHNHAFQVRVDRFGQISVAGVFSGELKLGALELHARGRTDAFVARLTPVGEIVWAVQGGGQESSGWEGAQALAVDQEGHTYLAGVVAGPAKFGAKRLNIDAATLFVCKIDEAGDVVWVTSAQSGRRWGVSELMLDSAGALYLGGGVTLPSGGVPIVLKLETKQGRFLWGAYPQGVLPPGSVGVSPWPPGPIDATARSGDNLATSIVVGANGEVIMAGHFTGVKRFGDEQVSARGGQDAFLAGISPQGTIRWARMLQGEAQDFGMGLVGDSEGRLWVAGHFEGSVEIGKVPLVSSSDFDVFVWKTTRGLEP